MKRLHRTSYPSVRRRRQTQMARVPNPDSQIPIPRYQCPKSAPIATRIHATTNRSPRSISSKNAHKIPEIHHTTVSYPPFTATNPSRTAFRHSVSTCRYPTSCASTRPHQPCKHQRTPVASVVHPTSPPVPSHPNPSRNGLCHATRRLRCVATPILHAQHQRASPARHDYSRAIALAVATASAVVLIVAADAAPVRRDCRACHAN